MPEVRPLLLSLCLLFLGARCADEREFNVGEPFTLKPGQTARCDGCELRLTFTGVAEDSRCPKNATCVWMGQVVAGFLVNGSDSLRITLQPGREGEAVAEAGRHLLRLVHVLPYPETGREIKPDEYSAELVVNEPATE